MEYVLNLAFRFLIAGTVVVAVSIAAEKMKNPLLAGILVMFPALTLLSVYFVGRSMGAVAAASIIHSAIITMPIWVVYALSLYYFLNNTGLVPAIAYSTMIFLAGAVVLVLIKLGINI